MDQLSVTTYAALRRKVEETLLSGQRKVEEAKIRTYWDTGRYLREHILFHKERADYGKQVLSRLSDDLEMDSSVLRRCGEFFAAFPDFKICAARHKLTWAHYRALIVVPDEKKRLALADQAEKGGWSSRDIEIRVRNLFSGQRTGISGGMTSLLPMPVLGPLYTYRILQPEAIHSKVPARVLDVGFSVKKDMALFPACKQPSGTVMTSYKDPKGHYILRPQTAGNRPQITNSRLRQNPTQASILKAQDSLLYTYKAFVEKVIDADTLKLQFDIGFGDWRGETIRLKGIDCPEIDTAEGKRAKAFVEELLKGCEFIVVKSVRTRKEKWGRYLGDVFLPKASDQRQATSDYVYLNNLLIEKGHAVRVRN